MPQISTFTDFSKQQTSEKIGLAVIESSRRLQGWALDAGSVYKFTDFEHSVVTRVTQDGTELTEVFSRSAVVPGTYYNDRQAREFFLETSDSADPDSKFIGLIFQNFFSNATGVRVPYDLSTGFGVDWLPLISNISGFGVEIDNKEFLGFALEGSGALNMINDRDYWDSRFDKWVWQNKNVYIYSWSPLIPITEAKIIYRGIVSETKLSSRSISFKMKDGQFVFRQQLPLSNIEQLPGAVVTNNLLAAKQRLLYGRVTGHIPTPIDQSINTGFEITGTANITNASPVIVGIGSTFLSEVSKDDSIAFGSSERFYTIKTVDSDTQLTLTENFEESTDTSVPIILKTSRAVRYKNRVFLVAGHPLKKISGTVVSIRDLDSVELSTVEDILPGDEIDINGNVYKIRRVSVDVKVIFTTTELNPTPAISDPFEISSIKNVFLDSDLLVKTRDYTIDSNTAKLTLDGLAEFNIASLKILRGTSITFTSTLRTVTGINTLFTEELKPGDWVRAAGQTDYFEVLRVDDDTNLVIRTAATYSATAVGEFKTPKYFQQGSSVLSCDSFGVTEDNTTTGTLLVRGSQIVKDIIKRGGILDADINNATFSQAEIDAPEILSLVVPRKFNDRVTRNLREIINEINQSIFGSLYQDQEFKFNYKVIQPNLSTFERIDESDTIDFKTISIGDKIVKRVVVEYSQQEYDPNSESDSNLELIENSQVGENLAETQNEFRVNTRLTDEIDAKIFVNRWLLIKEFSGNIITVDTTLQFSRLNIHDVIKFVHNKMFQRLGSSLKSRFALVSGVKKNFTESTVKLDDIGSAFPRIAFITDNQSLDFDIASEDDRLGNGYITDENGTILSDKETINRNLIW